MNLQRMFEFSYLFSYAMIRFGSLDISLISLNCRGRLFEFLIVITYRVNYHKNPKIEFSEIVECSTKHLRTVLDFQQQQ